MGEGAGRFEGEGAVTFALPVCSVLRVDGHAADELKHAVNAVTVGETCACQAPPLFTALCVEVACKNTTHESSVYLPYSCKCVSAAGPTTQATPC